MGVRGLVERDNRVLVLERHAPSYELPVVLVHEGDGCLGPDMGLELPCQWRIIHPQDLPTPGAAVNSSAAGIRSSLQDFVAYALRDPLTLALPNHLSFLAAAYTFLFFVAT